MKGLLCAYTGCERLRGPLPFLCMAHWALVPSEIQTRVCLAMSNRDSEAGCLEWLAAIRAAREAVTAAIAAGAEIPPYIPPPVVVPALR